MATLSRNICIPILFSLLWILSSRNSWNLKPRFLGAVGCITSNGARLESVPIFYPAAFPISNKTLLCERKEHRRAKKCQNMSLNNIHLPSVDINPERECVKNRGRMKQFLGLTFLSGKSSSLGQRIRSRWQNLIQNLTGPSYKKNKCREQAIINATLLRPNASAESIIR